MIKTNLKDFPESYDELKFSSYLDLLSLEDLTSKPAAIRAILGIPKGQAVEGMENLYRAAQFLNKPFEIDPNPKKIGHYEIPQDITAESAEQFEDISSEMKRVEQLPLRDKMEAACLYAAIYIQPSWFSTSYDSQQAKYLSKILLDYPCTEVMSAAAFFQARYLSLETGLSPSYLLRNIPQKKEKRDSISSQKRLVLMRPLIILRVMWAWTTMFFSKLGQPRGTQPK